VKPVEPEHRSAALVRKVLMGRLRVIASRNSAHGVHCVHKSVANLKDTMEHGVRPLKTVEMHPNALKTLPSGAARQGGGLRSVH
jgi:hypothetical protein